MYYALPQKSQDLSEMQVFFPDEIQALFFNEVCWPLIGTVVRGTVRCSVTAAGYPASTGLRWIEWYISTSPPSESRIRELERRIENVGSVYGRPYIKKRGGCR